MVASPLSPPEFRPSLCIVRALRMTAITLSYRAQRHNCPDQGLWPYLLVLHFLGGLDELSAGLETQAFSASAPGDANGRLQLQRPGRHSHVVKSAFDQRLVGAHRDAFERNVGDQHLC